MPQGSVDVWCTEAATAAPSVSGLSRCEIKIVNEIKLLGQWRHASFISLVKIGIDHIWSVDDLSWTNNPLIYFQPQWCQSMSLKLLWMKRKRPLPSCWSRPSRVVHQSGLFRLGFIIMCLGLIGCTALGDNHSYTNGCTLLHIRLSTHARSWAHECFTDL